MLSKTAIYRLLIAITTLTIMLASPCYASTTTSASGDLILHAPSNFLSLVALAIFVLAYIAVIFEEFIHLRKSKPVVLASGIIWIIVAIIAHQQGSTKLAEQAVRNNILEYAELFLFLLVAMTYVNAMQERLVFAGLRCWLTKQGLSLRQLFWVTGLLAFFISPFIDNLTTALVMSAIVLAIGKDKPKFIAVACINIVIAANAGGAYSPFGDITTLMVWQKGLLHTMDFFDIFIPAAISYLIPAFAMSITIPKTKPKALQETIKLLPGAYNIVLLFILTIAITICGHYFLGLPPVTGMMTGLGLLKFYGYFLKIRTKRTLKNLNDNDNSLSTLEPFDIIEKIERVEWDTLLFFYGIMLCVGGLATIGYLESVSTLLYHDLGAGLSAMHQQTPANVIVGLISAIIDNIPLMYAVLTMLPDMSHGQWLMVTLTTGIGGNLLSIGSAAGVALMGQARGMYTFFSHLKWSWIILIGYAAGVWSHVLLNRSLFFIDLD